MSKAIRDHQLQRHAAALRAQTEAGNDLARRAISVLGFGVAILGGGVAAAGILPEDRLTAPVILTLGTVGLMAFFLVCLNGLMAAVPPVPLTRGELLTRNPHSLRALASRRAKAIRKKTGALRWVYAGLFVEVYCIGAAVAIAASGDCAALGTC